MTAEEIKAVVSCPVCETVAETPATEIVFPFCQECGNPRTDVIWCDLEGNRVFVVAIVTPRGYLFKRVKTAAEIESEADAGRENRR